MSLRYQLVRSCIDNTVANPNSTNRVIKSGCKYFADWCKENGYNKVAKIEKNGKQKTIQEYADYLVEKRYSPATIHTYLYAPCKALNIGMEQIEKPKRLAENITRSRDETKNVQGAIEKDKPIYSRVVSLQRAVGLRRSELAKLKGGSLVEDESGKLCIAVNGKGGKYQLQKILPQDVETVKEIYQTVKSNEYVFSSTEMRNNIDLHGMRAEHARIAYEYYRNMGTDEKKVLLSELKARWLSYHPKCDEKSREYRKWYDQMFKGNGCYALRGSNYARAVKLGRETRYDRIALMAVSVFHLSHWRLDVTVKHYMI